MRDIIVSEVEQVLVDRLSVIFDERAAFGDPV